MYWSLLTLLPHRDCLDSDPHCGMPMIVGLFWLCIRSLLTLLHSSGFQDLERVPDLLGFFTSKYFFTRVSRLGASFTRFFYK